LKTSNRFVDLEIDNEDDIKTELNRLLCGDWIQVARRRVQWLDRVNKATYRRIFLQGGGVRTPLSDSGFPRSALFQAVDLYAGACVCLRHRYLTDAYLIV
jgi:hypothetical protein